MFPSAVTNVTPCVKAVAAMTRSTGSGGKSSNPAAKMPVWPDTGISWTPQLQDPLTPGSDRLGQWQAAAPDQHRHLPETGGGYQNSVTTGRGIYQPACFAAQPLEALHQPNQRMGIY